MIYDTFNKRKHVITYKKNIIPSREQIDNLIKKTWELTPSKNNTMAYEVFVLGPDKQKEKNEVYKRSVSNHFRVEDNALAKGNLHKSIHLENINYGHMLSCPYLLVITQRVLKEMNEYYKIAIEKDGHYAEQLFEHELDTIESLTALEVGLFANILTGLCVEDNLDVSYTSCFERDVSKWQPELNFVKRLPLLLMSIGKGDIYRWQRLKEKNETHLDTKADYNDVVKWL